MNPLGLVGLIAGIVGTIAGVFTVADYLVKLAKARSGKTASSKSALDSQIHFSDAKKLDDVKQQPYAYLQTKVPVYDTGFYGREEELSWLQSAFASQARLVILRGIGGRGKSRIA